MLNILVPMAGRGSRFSAAGFDLPKPLISVRGRVPMIRLVIENLRPKTIPARFIFLCLEEHLQTYNLAADLVQWAGDNTVVISVPGVTEGAACTALLARDHIDSDEPLMIANSDQFVTIEIDDYLGRLDKENLDGLIMTMSANDPKWSFVRLSTSGEITEVVEKQVVSDEATVGIYNFRQGSEFVRSADAMIAKRLKVNGEYYVAPAYNEMLGSGARLGYHNVGSEGNGMYGLGIPDDLRFFESLDLSADAVRAVQS